jgi:hypothetical protein
MPPDERPLPLGYGRDPKPNEKNKLAAVLFSFERVLDAADGVLNLTLNLVGVAFGLQLGVADRLADHLLDCALDLLRRSDDPVLVHSCILRYSLPERERIKLRRELVVVVDLDQQHFADDFRIGVTDSGQSGNCFDLVARATGYLEG